MKKSKRMSMLLSMVLMTMLTITGLSGLGGNAIVKADYSQLSATMGFLNDDTTPATGVIGNWGYSSTAVAVDYQNRSIGIDLATSQSVTKVELWDTDSSTRCTGSNYVLYWSNDNSSYTQISNVTFSSGVESGKNVHSFEFAGITARYIKIHTTYSDANYTFVLSPFQSNVIAFNGTPPAAAPALLPSIAGYVRPDSNPASGQLSNWSYSLPVGLDYTYTSVGVDLFGIVPVDSIEVLDSDTSTRITQSNYTLYRSDNNVTYTQITGWTFSTRTDSGRLVHKFSFSSVNARYLKVCCNLSDTSWTFRILNIDKDVRAFSSTTAASTVIDIAPSRNTEGDVISLKNGNLFMAWTAFTGGGDDADPSYIAGKISTDNGYTWGSTYTVLANEGTQNTMSVSLLRMGNGDLGIFYLRKNSASDCKVYFRRSTDEGSTWSSPICATSTPNGYYVLNNARVVRLSTGRILVPVAYCTDTSQVSNMYSRAYYSDDDGVSWNQGSGTVTLATGAWEPGVIELKNGNVMMNIRRGGGGNVYKATSTNGGNTWSAATSTGLTAPSSPSTIRRIPATGDLLIIWNNSSSNRYPLTSAISTDDGANWTHIKNIETASDGYAYISTTFLGREVILTYYKAWGHRLKILDTDWFYN